MKKIIITFIFCVGIFLSAQSALAADFNTECAASTCSPSTIYGFFPASEVWYPTKTFSQSILLKNTSGSFQQITAEPFNFTDTQEGADLSKVIQYTITRQSDNQQVWTGSLYSFYHSGGVNLLNALAKDASDTFVFNGEMYSTAGNEYQDLITQFDLLLTATTDESSLTPTPTPPCSIKAAEVPGPLSLNRNNSNEVKVTWGMVNGATGYELSWGTNSSADNKGSKSVGTTSETTIGGLELDTNRYYFKVRSVKDCAKSDWNGIRSIGTGTDLLAGPTATPPPGQTLGVATFRQAGFVVTPVPTLTTIPTPSVSQDEGTVKGASTEQTCNCIWWQILLGEALVAALFFWKFAKKVSKTKYRASIALGVVVPFIVFRILNTCFTYSYFIFANTSSIACKYFVVWEFAILVVLQYVFHHINKKQDKITTISS